MAVVVKDRTCRQCWAVFRGGPRAWYCPACRSVRAKEAQRRLQEDGTSRTMGSIDHCTVCGKEYVVLSARQKYCPDCVYEAVRAVDRPASRAWNQARKETYYPEKNAKRKARRVADPEPILAKEREQRKKRRSAKTS